MLTATVGLVTGIVRFRLIATEDSDGGEVSDGSDVEVDDVIPAPAPAPLLRLGSLCINLI